MINTVSIFIRTILFGVTALTLLCGPCKFCNWTSMTTENTALVIWVARHNIGVYRTAVFYPHWSVLLIFFIRKRLHKNQRKLSSAAISVRFRRGNRKQTITGAEALLRRQSTSHVYQSIAWNVTIEKYHRWKLKGAFYVSRTHIYTDKHTHMQYASHIHQAWQCIMIQWWNYMRCEYLVTTSLHAAFSISVDLIKTNEYLRAHLMPKHHKDNHSLALFIKRKTHRWV